MAEDIEHSGSGPAPGSEGSASAAIALALGQSGSLDPRAAAFLEKQGRLADEQTVLAGLQAEDLRREDSLRHWSLRVRHVSDVMKLAFELSLAFILVALAVGIGTALWSAAHDNGLVIEAFSVPPDMAQKGLTGQVVATQVLDRLSAMQAQTDSVRAADTFKNNWGGDIKVQIPDTGISIGEFYRILVSSLGRETEITGEVYRTANGIAVSARAGSEPAQVSRGREADLDALVDKAAENVYRQTQPYRYGVYLLQHGRIAEATAVIRALALTGPAEERPWAYTVWGLLPNVAPRDGLEKERIAAKLGPNMPNVLLNLGAAEAFVGHDEAALRASREASRLLESSAGRQLAAYAVTVQIPATRETIDELLGDYDDAIAQLNRTETLTADYNSAHEGALFSLQADLAAKHDVAASRRLGGAQSDAAGIAPFLVTSGGGNYSVPPLPALARAVAQGDWRGARDDLDQFDRLPDVQSDYLLSNLWPALTWPWLAYADAKLGDFGAAHSLIDRTALDCYLCLRMRGNIDAAQKNWSGAQYWFGVAVAAAPSVPFAYIDWGQMLLTKGDDNGAIAKFTLANQKSPYFADPLEMWGEALMSKNRSDLALAKFEEANKYAPNWGRLHLKWGDALLYSGDKNGAEKQFALTAHLDLSAAEKSELASHSGTPHG
jgi:tetratricopeptide (TPR) repeat protein